MNQRVCIVAILLFVGAWSCPSADAQIPSNSPPVADAGPNQKVGTKPLQAVAVTLSGAGSFDPDGDPLSYQWRDGNGNAVGGTQVVNVSLLPGSYFFGLTVRDGRGGTGSAGASVRVLVDDDAPLVIPPSDLAVGKTQSNGARGANSDDLARFLAAGTASDALA